METMNRDGIFMVNDDWFAWSLVLLGASKFMSCLDENMMQKQKVQCVKYVQN